MHNHDCCFDVILWYWLKVLLLGVVKAKEDLAAKEEFQTPEVIIERLESK